MLQYARAVRPIAHRIQLPALRPLAASPIGLLLEADGMARMTARLARRISGPFSRLARRGFAAAAMHALRRGHCHWRWRCVDID